MNTRSDQINVSSQPTGAKLLVNGQVLGTTPLHLDLPAKNTYYLEFRKTGFETKMYVLTGNVGAGWVIADVLLGLVPVVIDAATGKWYEFNNGFIDVELDETNPAHSDTISTLKNDDLPASFSVSLSDNQLYKLLGGNTVLIYQSAKWGTSSLRAVGIIGMSEDTYNDTTQKSINIKKHDIFYMKISDSIKYKVEVTQEVWNTLSLDFTRI